ncbi:MAG: hypothetical protein HY706_00490 [Candidatus Hydrogenedentes bacterium]|nr:hypothetical protein [Candidatus Hydrogenedentota bacterium]
MTQPLRMKLGRWLVASVIGAMTGFLVWYLGGPMGPILSTVPASPPKPLVSKGKNPEPVPSGPGMAYARALQSGDYEQVVSRTDWMMDRLERVRLETDDVASVEAARVRLCDALRERRPGGNRLTLQGMEDQYVFMTDAALKTVAMDTGRTDLDRPVKSREWIRVTYAAPERAPRDEADQPIHAWTIGVNLSDAGTVLKAGVVGNLEFDRDSISYDWNRVPGA